MSQKPFEWSFELNENTSAAIPSEKLQIPPKESWAAHLRQHIYLIIFLAMLSILYLVKGGSQSGSQIQSQERANVEILDLLVPLVPIPKGELLSPDLLKQVPVRMNSLTKSERLQAVRAQDASRLKVGVRARRNLPPHKVLSWQDLNFFSASPAAIVRPTLHFSNDPVEGVSQ